MKYNWPIVGHKNVVEYLQSCLRRQACLKAGMLNHAYLFSGPSNVGKTTTAEHFVKSLLCLDEGKLVPCEKCSMCQQFEKGIHSDVVYMERQEDKKDIAIEQVRELRQFIALSTFLGKYKIAIIKEAELLNKEASNCLLKTLEEPSKDSILILITSQINRLPKTIVSRCQQIRFLTVDSKEIIKFLEREQGLKKDQAKILAHLCGGRPGIAINFLKAPDQLEDYQASVENFIKFLEFGLIDKFKLIDQLVFRKDFLKSQKIFKQLLALWLSVVRDLVLIKMDLNSLVYNSFVERELKRLADKYSVDKLVQILDKINQTKICLDRNVNPKLAVENLSLSL